jgi:hypothetical protein
MREADRCKRESDVGDVVDERENALVVAEQRWTAPEVLFDSVDGRFIAAPTKLHSLSTMAISCGLWASVVVTCCPCQFFVFVSVDRNVGYAVLQALKACPDMDLRAVMARNIVCTGGGATIPGFQQRLISVRERPSR